jgi:glycosyltransferase involved in cell wall biosynthesis
VRVLIDYRPALRERSGVGEYTHELVRALLAEYRPDDPRHALRLTLFSSSWKDRFRASADLAGATRIDRRVPVSVLNLAWHRLEWPAIETLAGAAFEVAHSSHPLLMPSRAAAQVITIHDLNFVAHPERTQAEIRRDYGALVGDHARRADAVIVSSAFTAGDVERRLGVARDRIAICPPGAPDWEPRTAAPPNGYLLFFGTLEPRKNVGGLLDAYELLIRAHDAADARTSERSGEEVSARAFQTSGLPELVLAGRATDGARPWLDRIARPPLAGRVRHIGYVEPSRRRDLYVGARLLVQPSFEEGFGITVLEAMSLGVPVVAARRGSLPEVAGDAALFVDPDSPEDLARGLQRMAGDGAFAADCAEKGLARARAFRWSATARLVYETYQRAFARRAQRSGAASRSARCG